MRSDPIWEPVSQILKASYGISRCQIAEQQGGWSARAFQVKTDNNQYFLKVYDKKESSTNQWTANLGVYLPFLADASELEGWVPQTIPTLDGQMWAETDRFLTILDDYITGETLGATPLSPKQAAQLGTILGRLHQIRPVPGQLEPVRENFAVPFCGKLQNLLQHKTAANVPDDILQILSQYEQPLKWLTQRLQRVSEQQKTRNLPLVPCHTDIHGWNLMQGEHLILIDWEGLRYAPIEADFFALTELKVFPELWKSYRRECPNAIIDPACLEFYQLRRRCEDIWEFAARILQDELDLVTRRESFAGFCGECAALAEQYNNRKG